MLATVSGTVIIVVVCILLFWVISLASFVKCYQKPDQGQVIIRNGVAGLRISFSGIVVIPLIHKAEFLDITLKRLVINRCGKDALECKDGMRMNVEAAFFVRVKPAVEEIRKVVRKLGIKGASDIRVLCDLFNGRFIETLESVSRRYDFDELSNREFFKEQVVSALNLDTDGYVLDVVAIDHLSRSEHYN